jgi:hypothetical protein
MNEDITEELERNLQTQFQQQKSGKMLKMLKITIKRILNLILHGKINAGRPIKIYCTE